MVTTVASGSIAASDCTHRWQIETPNGPHSHGTCHQCGAEGEFRNSEPEDNKRLNNSDLFAHRRATTSEQQPRNEDRDLDVALRSMYQGGSTRRV